MDTFSVNGSEARLLTDDRFLRKAADLYYSGFTQEAIANQIPCSRQTVSKALQKARERGIVKISIDPDIRTGYLRTLSQDIRTVLGLDELVLAAGQSMESLDTPGILDDVVDEIARVAADYLDRQLKEQDILAVSGGKMFMRNMVRHLKPGKELPDMRVIATIGFANAHTNFGDANMIAYDLAQAYKARHHWFPCPAFLRTEEELRFTRQLPVIKEGYELMQQASIIVTGLWRSDVDEMVLQGILTHQHRSTIQRYGPAADINHWIFDANGQCINGLLEEPLYYLSGLEIPRLKQKVQQGARVILVAGGSPFYVPAIRAVLKAGLINILVTDHVTAQLLLTSA